MKKGHIMTTLLYGTTNEAKLAAMRNSLKDLPVDIIGLKDTGREIPEVDEVGNSPLENASIKAKAYYEAFCMPVFSCDSGLYFENIPDIEQPGLYVRRREGRNLDDEEMIEYYADLAHRYGGRLIGRYRNAICLVLDKEEIYTSEDISLATEPFYLVETPHEKRVEGFPLDTLSVDIASGLYYYDLEGKELSSSCLDNGFRNFFSEILPNNLS